MNRISDKDIKILCCKNGPRCAMPDCRKPLVIDGVLPDPDSLIAEMAHIKGEKPTAARYDENMTDVERNAYPNRMFLCSSCHKKIDDQPVTYTVERLLKIKKENEEWVISSTNEEVVNVTFAELNIITKHLVSGQTSTCESLTLIPPKDKINKNGLSNAIEHTIMMGMTQVKQVEDFISKCPDMEFGDRLRKGFVAEYERLKNVEMICGDDLFDCLLSFASANAIDFKQRAAGLSVLVYLFEKCEVFEK